MKGKSHVYCISEKIIFLLYILLLFAKTDAFKISGWYSERYLVADEFDNSFFTVT